MASHNIEQYMLQWLETATKGKVIVTFAFLTDRMQLHCKECHSELTVPRPKDSTDIDYGVQEFVKLHAHKVPTSDPMLSYMKPPGFGPGVILKNIQVPGKIDENPEKAQIIADQMKQYEAEMKAKLDSVALANKIKLLQMQDQAKAKQATEENKKKPETTEVKFPTEYYNKKTLETLKMQMFSYIPLGAGPVESHSEPPAPVPPPVKKDKPLRRPEGRKFR